MNSQDSNSTDPPGDAVNDSTGTNPAALPRNVKLLGWSSFLNDVSSEMIVPLLPMFLQEQFKAGPKILGLIEGLADALASTLKLLFGVLSDRAGKRKVFVNTGYLVAAVSRPLIGLAGTWWQVLLARLGDRTGKGIRTAPRDAMIAESTELAFRGRAFGFHRAMDHLGATCGPLIAALLLWLWTDSIHAVFLLALIPGLAATVLVFVGLKEPRQASAPQVVKVTAQPSTVVPGYVFRRYLLAVFIFALGNSSDAFILTRAGELGVPKAWLGVLWAAFHVVKAWSNWIGGAANDRLGPHRMLYVGWGLYAVSYLGFGLADSAWQAWVLFGIYALHFGTAEPAEKLLVSRIASASRQGTAFGWFNLSIGLAGLPASWIFGMLYESWGPLAAFGWGATLSLIASLILVAVPVGKNGP